MKDDAQLQLVRDTYQRMTDEELVRVATQNATGLTEAAQEIVRKEIERRGLDAAIVQGVQVQNKRLTEDELDVYCELARSLDCPVCGNADTKLNATLVMTVRSFIFLTQWKKKIKVACPDCLDKANNSAMISSALLGWWGIPWGFIKTPQAIIQNLRSKNANRLDEPNRYLKSYVLSKVGQFETYKENRNKLQEVIST